MKNGLTCILTLLMLLKPKVSQILQQPGVKLLLWKHNTKNAIALYKLVLKQVLCFLAKKKQHGNVVSVDTFT